MKRITFCLFLFVIWPSCAQLSESSEGKFMSINGADIYYEEYGLGEPLIFLHGFGRTLEDWKPYISEFSKTYRVIAWDMRGHGRSSNPDTSETFLHSTAAHDLISFMDSLKLKKVKAIGHSSGGIVILSAAVNHPNRFEAIIPISAQIYFGTQTREFIKINATPDSYYEFNELESQHGTIKGKILAKQFYHFHKLEGDPNITSEQLKNVTARTLVVHGDNDFVPVSQAFEIYQGINNRSLWVVPNGWHLPHDGENVNDFIIKASKFLKNEWD